MASPIFGEVGPERRPAYKLIVFLVALAAAFGFGALALKAPRSAPELKAEDALARLARRPARPDVGIVALDADSVAKYGPIKSWPRSLLADALRHVEAGKPNGVVFDLALAQRRPTGDESLWRTMANDKNVLLGMAYDADRPPKYTPDDIASLVYLEKFALAGNLTLSDRLPQFPYYDFEPPIQDFTKPARGVGVFDRETDADGVLRRARLIYRSTVQYPEPTRPLRGKFPQSQLDDGKPVALTNLALIAALGTFHVDKDMVEVSTGNDVRITGDLNPPVIVPINALGMTPIRYAAPGAYQTYTFRDVVSGKIKPDVFAGKTVLIGATAPGDEATSVEATPTGPMPRVEVTANALSTLLDRSYVRVVSEHRPRLLGTMILIGVVTGLLLMLVSGGRAVLMSLFLLLGYLAACWGFFALGHLLLPILPGVLVILTTMLVSLLLYFGPFQPTRLRTSPIFAPPSRMR